MCRVPVALADGVGAGGEGDCIRGSSTTARIARSMGFAPGRAATAAAVSASSVGASCAALAGRAPALARAPPGLA